MFISKSIIKTFFFSSVLILLSGCNHQANLENSKLNNKELAKKSFKEKAIANKGKELKEHFEALEDNLILNVERTPVKVMRSLVYPYVNGDKAIGLHSVDMVISFGDWNAKKENKPSDYLGGIHE